MTLSGILTSRSQRRQFLLASGLALTMVAISIFAVAEWSPTTRLWDAFNNVLIAILASGIFAIFSWIYLSYIFSDPYDLEASSVLLPQDIGRVLTEIALNATEYKIYVRTGRHFRAEILSTLIKQARLQRRPIRIEVILLDLRDSALCDKYAGFRKASSFDSKLWNREYVQKEVLATIIALVEASRENAGLLDVHIFLSKRLSIFRIEGSAEEILITREDPKDTAARYRRSHRDFPAFVTELSWIRDDAFRVEVSTDLLLDNIKDIVGDNSEVTSLLESASKAVKEPSPYAR